MKPKTLFSFSFLFSKNKNKKRLTGRAPSFFFFFFCFSKFPLLTLVLFFILFLYFENKMKNGLQDANSKSFLENKNENRLKTCCRTAPKHSSIVTCQDLHKLHVSVFLSYMPVYVEVTCPDILVSPLERHPLK